VVVKRWLRRLWTTSPPSPRKARIRLNLEVLEQRTTPTVFTVNSLAETVAINFTTGVDASGQVSLRSAVQAADHTGGANTIILPAGQYNLTKADGAAEANDASSGDLDIYTTNLTLVGAGANVTTIDASAIKDRVFLIQAGGVVQVSGVTITGGSAIGSGGVAYLDGSSTLSLTNCVLTGNYAIGSKGGTPTGGTMNGFGGAVYNSGALTVTNCTLSGNYAIGGAGGARVDGDGGGGGGGFGGAIYNASAGTVQLNNDTVDSNYAIGGDGGDGGNSNGGGGGGGFGGGGGGFAGNGGGGGFGGGGGGYNANGGVGGFGGGGGGGGNGGNGGGGGGGFGGGGGNGGNGAGGGGGGAGLGGGLFDNSGNGGSVQILNCTVTQNHAIGGRGGPGFARFNGTGGFGGGGGVIDYTGTIFVQNTIIAGNTGNSPDVFGALFTSGSYNLIGDGTGSSGFSTAADQVGTAANPIDPMLGQLQDNGGPTPTRAPLPGSRAIDKGILSGGVPTDQRGLRRTFVNAGIAKPSGGDGTDIGAVEVGSPDVVYVVGVDHSLTQVSYAGSVVLSGAGSILAVSSATNSAGQDVVFAITSDTHLWQHDAAGWRILSAGSFQSISAATNKPGDAVIFGVLTDNSLWENSSLIGGDHWLNLSPAGTVLSISAVVSSGMGAGFNDEVFAVTSDHNLWQHDAVSGWALLSRGNFASISAGRNTVGSAEVFGVLADNSLWEYNPASTGDGWRNLSPAGTILSVAAGGRDEVFAITSDQHQWDHTASGWKMLSVGSFASVSAGESSGEVFAVLTDASLWAFNSAYANAPWVNLLLAGTSQLDSAPRRG
jgi:hypothetical protein